MSERVVSGMRPTGQLHLGHYHGVIANWLELQQNYECYFFVADWHSLTTEYEKPDLVKQYSFEMVCDWLAAGLDPEKAVIFIQSQVPQHAELHLLLSMLTPLSWLTRVPSYKEIREQLAHKDLSTYGFLGYPLLQSADVLIYQGNHVPVGQDQVAHLELTREIARRFNHLYGETFVEPKAMLTEASKLLGLDGRKMSKSYQNALSLAESWESVSKRVMGMMTDPARKRRTDAGDPALCPVFDYHKLYTSQEKREEITQACRSASIGCVDCKKIFLAPLAEFYQKHQENRQKLIDNPTKVYEVLEKGALKAKLVAQKNLELVYQKLGMR